MALAAWACHSQGERVALAGELERLLQGKQMVSNQMQICQDARPATIL